MVADLRSDSNDQKRLDFHSGEKSFLVIALLISLLFHSLLGGGWLLWEFYGVKLSQPLPPEEFIVAELVQEPPLVPPLMEAEPALEPPPPSEPEPIPEPPEILPPELVTQREDISNPQLEEGELEEESSQAESTPEEETVPSLEEAEEHATENIEITEEERLPDPLGLEPSRKVTPWYDGIRTDALNTPPKPQPKDDLDGKLTQNEHDWLLSRILRHWRPPSDLINSQYEEASVSLIVLPNGTFDSPFNRTNPYNPSAVATGYNSLPPRGLKRRSIDSFYRAIRASQPLVLPKSMIARAPFRIHLVFKLDDVL